MASLTTSQIHAVGEWCAERGMLPQRIDAADIKAACASLGIALVVALSQPPEGFETRGGEGARMRMTTIDADGSKTVTDTVFL